MTGGLLSIDGPAAWVKQNASVYPTKASIARRIGSGSEGQSDGRTEFLPYI